MGGAASAPRLRLAPGGTWGAPLRSLLFCPGNNERRMHKALAAGANAVILDLEDSVHPDAKSDARALVAKVLAADRTVAVVVRVNADDTGWHLPDLAAILPARPDAIMPPKCDGPRALRRLSDRLDALEAVFDLPHHSTAVLPLITETARALADMAYGEVTPRLAASWPSTRPFPIRGAPIFWPRRPGRRRWHLPASSASTPTRSRRFTRPSGPPPRGSPGRGPRSMRLARLPPASPWWTGGWWTGRI
jgi:hypothetical protein